MIVRRFTSSAGARSAGLGLLLSLVPLAGCIQTQSGTSQQSTASVTFSGVTKQKNQTLYFYLRDRRNAAVGATPAETYLTWATTAGTETSTGSGLYSFSVTIPASTLHAGRWIPQTADGRTYGGLARSVGRVEIVGRPAGAGQPNLLTYTGPALTCANAASDEAGVRACSDGDSFLVFDNDGVGLTADAATATDFNKTEYALTGGAAGITMEVGTYNVPVASSGAVTSTAVNAIVCRPSGTPAAPGRRTIVLNHGGYEIAPWALDTCIDWAKSGWVAAMTAYRYEAVMTTPPPPPPGFPPYTPLYTYPSQANMAATGDAAELCLGEVTDALRWLDIVRARPDTDDNQILMWGYSHGACVTLRSLEQGARVKAAVAISGPTDFFLWDTWLTNTDPYAAAGVHWLLGGDSTTLADAYTARSATRMAVDLKRRSDVKLLHVAVQQDLTVHPSQACRLANAIGAESHRLLSNGYFYAGTPTPVGPDFAGCIPGYITFTPGLPAAGWPERAYFLLYDNPTPGIGHYLYGHTNPQSWNTSTALYPIRDFVLSSFP